jgi:phosphotransferase system enzyme I (PtsI)
LLQANPEILRDQARAITRASEHGPVKVLFPMIVDLEQYKTLRNDFLKAAEDLPHGDIAFGVMFEVPAACLQAETIFEHVDFASIGTNDLIQYLFAVDRDNDKVAYDYHPDRPVFWSLIGRLVALANARQCPLSICGELAGDPQYIPKLMELGVQNISVSPRLIPGVRRAVSAAMAASNA